MIKHLLALCMLLFLFTGISAQPYGNEWIVFSQKYYKIKIAQNGVYRIDSASLFSAGIPVGSGGTDPRNFQLFHEGSEKAIFIQGENDGEFNAGDVIEFYAEKNNGSRDSLVYHNTAFVPNPYYSLFNDTAVYFLTWNGLTTNSRMQVDTSTTFGSYPQLSHFIKDEVLEFHSDYYAGETDLVGGTDARYTRSEGWFGSVLSLGGSVTYNVNTSNRYLAGPPARISTVVLGASQNTSVLLTGPDHFINIKYNGQLFKDSAFRGYDANRFIRYLPADSLGSASTSFTFSSMNAAGLSSNRTAISYINIRYPHTFDLEGQNKFLMHIPDTAGISHLNMTNFSTSGQAWLYDLSNARKILVTQSGSNFHALIINTGAEKKCFISSEGNFMNVSPQPVNALAQFTDFGAISSDSAYIIVTNPVLMSSANDYKTYRASLPYGGGHNVIVADVNELYDQFAYGVIKSPLSIKNFSAYLLDNFSSAPQNLFLIGKSIHMRHCRQNNSNYALNLVPSFGNPSSDNLFTAGLNGTILAPAIPTGRLAAKNLNDVDLYLEKMKDYEDRNANPPAEWMKQVLHFGGGTGVTEQVQFSYYLNNYKKIVEDTLYGGHVTDFFKTSSAPIEINTSDTLAAFINSGVSLMTFFGHASGTGFDQSIDDIDSYSPEPGHYPFLLANSCYAGDFHSTGISSSEEFILIENKGMIGYLGSVGLGVPYVLNTYSNRFYEELSRNSYGRSVGTLIHNTITGIQVSALAEPLLAALCFDMSLHGDPALKINTHEAPDYKIINSDVYFDQTSHIDSLTIFAIRTNIGKAGNDSIFTEVLRILPNGDSLVYLSRNPAPKYKDTISFTIPVDFVNGIGLNKIKVTLDRNLEVAELNEMNNYTTLVDLLINGGTIAPVYPYEFAIIPNNTVTLKASTADPLASARNYLFQIDTTDTFTAPLASAIINSAGGVLSWAPPLILTDTTVYYWRVSPDSTSPASGYSWRESSFQYINGKRGWEQAHFFQFKNNGYQFVKFNRPDRKFDFVNDIKSIYCKNGIYPYIPYYDIIYKVNGTTKYLFSWIYPDTGFTFAVFDPISGENWQNVATGVPPGGTYNSITGYPLGTKENAFEYDDFPETDVTNFINLIPAGHYVLMYTQGYSKFGSYSTTLTNAFETLGASDLNTLSPSVPYILWGQKGMPPGTATEVIGGNFDSIIDLTASFTTNWNDGYIASPVIGPALSWDSLSWKYHSIDGGILSDSISIQVIGIAPGGAETVLTNLNSSTLDVPNLSSIVSASAYPTIRLVAYMKDDSLTTPPQMDRWQVFYTPVPEAAINPLVGYVVVNDTIQEGDKFQLQLPVQNISEYTFSDSLLFTYWIEDANRVKHSLPDKLKKDLFAAAEIIIDTIIVNTTNYPGSNALWVEVNPVGQPRSQPEQYHFNNIIRIPFYTTIDKINPLLDVTFDGVHILNNDIISAKPNILIRLKDENQFLALNDTSDFKVFLQSPGSAASVAKRIWFGTEMSFIPALLPNNSCQINYTPTLTLDGTYQLIVQAKDISNNQSGSIDYKISFEVINRATITEVMNYPNPFSTSTRFVFTLTGSEVPQNFKIQIMTITGKVVREIFQDELGPLHIGRNISDYAWDGKDEFGDQLANGVYLYRVQTRLNGANIEKRETEADQYFKKGWGKMYLMR